MPGAPMGRVGDDIEEAQEILLEYTQTAGDRFGFDLQHGERAAALNACQNCAVQRLGRGRHVGEPGINRQPVFLREEFEPRRRRLRP